MCRVLDAFVARLALSELGFERAQAAETGRPGYDPRDLLKLYLYGYLNQIRSSRRLEAECRRNIELMWLLGRLYPDHKSISEFRRMHSEAVTAAGAALIRFARSCGLIRGEWIAINGSKFRAVASVDSTRERLDLQRYLESIKKADEEQQANIDQSAVQVAVERLKQHPEPEVGYMLVRQTALPAYNVQTAVDAEHALIVAHAVVLDASDIRCLKPMAEAAKYALARDFQRRCGCRHDPVCSRHCVRSTTRGMAPYSVAPTSVMNRKAIRTSVPETKGCYANILITKTDTRCIKRRLPTVPPAR
jgi:transposase